MDRYKIIRFRRNGRQRVIARGLTLEEARRRCSREDTHKAGVWFDGYIKE